MNKTKIIVTPRDVLEHLTDPIGEAVLYVNPSGIHQINEISDYITHKDDVVKYHIHDHGYELFTMTKGSVEAILGGKRCVANVGDMMMIKPFTPHAFRYREDGTVWQELIQQLALYDNERSLARVLQNCPQKLDDPEFMRYFQRHNGRVDYPEVRVMDTEFVEPDEMPGFVGAGKYYKKFDIPGIQCMLKYPRWELNGIKEIWEFILEEGVSVNWGDHYYDSELFVVRKGSVRVEVQGYEPGVAHVDDIIDIPNYTTHSMTALESGTQIVDCNCRYDLFLLLEELFINKRVNPGVIGSEYIQGLLSRYDCPVTGISLPEGEVFCVG